jgi:hypothetical protein
MEAVLSLVEVAGKARARARDGNVDGRAAFDLQMTYATGLLFYQTRRAMLARWFRRAMSLDRRPTFGM